ncbi:MAG: ABC transporter permease [Bryobacteraceae bacterium]
MLSGIRQTARALLRRPAFTAAALLTVALGAGANTAVFSIVHAVLLDPLPFRDPDHLVQVWETHPELHNLQVAYPDFADWKAAARTVDLAAYTFQSINRITLLGEGDPQQVQASMASGALFPMMGIEALRGRVFTEDEDRRGDRVAVISETLWRSKFNSNPNIIGRQIRLDQLSFTVVGVMPQRQAFPEWADVWMPLSHIDAALKPVRQFHPLEVVGRLKPAVTVAQAQSELDSIASRLAAENPATNRTIGAFVVPLAGQITGEVRPALLILWSAVGLVLLIVSANLAHLMMARALDRHREVAIRLALGAGRGEILRQILSESLLLAIGGGVLGIAIAAALMPVLRAFAQQRIPRVEHLALDLPVLLFGIGVSALAGLLFGLPAWWQLRNSDLTDVMKSAACTALTAASLRFESGTIARVCLA